MHSFLVKEYLNTKCPKLGKISLVETLPKRYIFVHFGLIPSLVGKVVVAMVIVIGGSS